MAIVPALIILAGAAAALASAALPWLTDGRQSVLTPMDAKADFSDLANGYFLLGGGIAAAVAGLALLLRLIPRLAKPLALVAIVGGALILGVEFSAYDKASKVVDAFGARYAFGAGLYLGAAGGAAAVLGGVIRLFSR